MASREEYERVIYGPIRQAIPQLDPSGTLRPEWTNARGAIARFDRNSIEIRLIDLQECPAMDLAVASLVIGVLRELVSRNQAAAQREVKTETLVELLGRCITEADQAEIDPYYLQSLGLPGPMTVSEAWKRLRARVERLDENLLAEHGVELDFLEQAGPLARRILRAAGPTPSRSRLREVYLHLADCLHSGRVFEP
jgi:hypothetical protein